MMQKYLSTHCNNILEKGSPWVIQRIHARLSEPDPRRDRQILSQTNRVNLVRTKFNV